MNNVNVNVNVNVVFLVCKFYSFSGAANQALKLASLIKPEVIDLTILNIEDFDCEDKVENGVLVKTIKRGKFSKYISELISYRKPVVVHSHGFYLDFLFFCYVLRVPYIIKSTLYRSDDFDSLGGSRLGYLKLFIAKKCVANNSLTNQIRNVNAKYMKKERVFTVPNTVKFPNETLLAKKKKKVIFVGGYVRRKRPDLAIKFFNQQFGEDYEFHLYGPSSDIADFDEGYLDYCKNLSNERVIFHPKISSKQVSEVMMESKCLLFFSESEGMPNVVLEALAHNCVPIVSEMDGLSKEILPASLYWLISTNLEEAPYGDLEKNIDALIESRELLDYCRLKFGRERVVQGNISMYRLAENAK